MKKILLLSLFTLAYLAIFAQAALTVTGTGGTIRDTTNNAFSLTVSGTGHPSNTDTVWGVKSVYIDLRHNYDSDLDIYLVSPSGTIIDLSTRNGGSGRNYSQTTFSMNATRSIFNGTAPFRNTYKPQGLLGTFNKGEPVNGTWTLHVNDLVARNTGTLNSWRITFDTVPPKPFPFYSSNLPIVKINTHTNPIIDYPPINASMQIINNPAPARNNYNDTPNDFVGNISIQFRGSSSQSFPQKSYGFTIIDSTGNSTNASVLGMPAESDWILYAPWDDKSIMRNILIYQLANEMGRYASRCRLLELFVNDEYAGVYVMMEKIKRDHNRVNIANLKPQDTTGTQLTGGYIIKIDKLTGTYNQGWNSAYWSCDNQAYNNHIYYQYSDPNQDVMPLVQQQYIQQYVLSFENALHAANYQDTLNGWRQFFGEKSAIDFSIANEISKNVDGYRLSTFFSKDKNGKIKMGPIWDYNIAFGNANYNNGDIPSGWQWQYSCSSQGDKASPFWWTRLWTDTLYRKNYACRWNDLRSTVLDIPHVNHIIDSLGTLLQESKSRHFTRWPILGVALWPNAYVGSTFQQEIDTLKGWIVSRFHWMDSQLPYDSTCHQTVVTSTQQLLPGQKLNIYPNPTTGQLFVLTSQLEQASAEIFNELGISVMQLSIEHTDRTEIDVRSLPPGIYTLRLRDKAGTTEFAKFIKAL